MEVDRSCSTLLWIDDGHAARRRYKKDLDQIKPDLEAYNRQKAIALGLNPSSSNALTTFSSGPSSSAVTITSEEQRLAHENLYRDANTLIYGDNKPSDEAIDRVVGKINKDIEKKAKFHRKRVNEVEGDITYINEHNRVFNNKVWRTIGHVLNIETDISRPDQTLLRQVYYRNSGKLRAWHSFVRGFRIVLSVL